MIIKFCKIIFLTYLMSFLVNANAGLFGNKDNGMYSECMSKHSKAWCIFDAAEMSKDLNDVNKESFDKAFNTEKSSAAVDLGMAALSTQNFMSTRVDVLGKGGGIGMILLNALMHDRPKYAISNRLVAWMPMELARNEEEAGYLIEQIMFDATEKSFDGYVLKEQISVLPEDENKYSTAGRAVLGWSIKGKDCDKTECKLVQMTVGRGGFIYDRKGKKGKAPEWAGGYDAWVFNYGTAPSIYGWIYGNEFISQKYSIELSKNLPNWAYVTLTPEIDYDGTKYNKGVALPLVLNKGKVFGPIFPEVDFNEIGNRESKK